MHNCHTSSSELFEESDHRNLFHCASSTFIITFNFMAEYQLGILLVKAWLIIKISAILRHYTRCLYRKVVNALNNSMSVFRQEVDLENFTIFYYLNWFKFFFKYIWSFGMEPSWSYPKNFIIHFYKAQLLFFLLILPSKFLCMGTAQNIL